MKCLLLLLLYKNMIVFLLKFIVEVGIFIEQKIRKKKKKKVSVAKSKADIWLFEEKNE